MCRIRKRLPKPIGPLGPWSLFPITNLPVTRETAEKPLRYVDPRFSPKQGQHTKLRFSIKRFCSRACTMFSGRQHGRGPQSTSGNVRRTDQTRSCIRRNSAPSSAISGRSQFVTYACNKYRHDCPAHRDQSRGCPPWVRTLVSRECRKPHTLLHASSQLVLSLGKRPSFSIPFHTDDTSFRLHFWLLQSPIIRSASLRLILPQFVRHSLLIHRSVFQPHKTCSTFVSRPSKIEQCRPGKRPKRTAMVKLVCRKQHPPRACPIIRISHCCFADHTH